ncbi:MULTISPECIES: protein adenylyltransferase SelO [unclassified Undibacterium]|uniref:protein adenylyltransferase SelO n=1 Tax=unclassified Undibacterium TaxID=2630295 RepID=UPI002AC8D6B2|nr:MULTISPECIES: YdiU family protein [unclassified Undibacterium]MEB0141055.1 YdiU family protein [Undibacterium sp. CCC2.1]MEB0174033.1 YdiU family protein [Undibacterium sp. CCC1.1]MEB0178002.1 YdiU family protein [Undibacterium sp. CCC3.4]MEB0217226.1 YdiU family protein [Undibacterium sp. 5I2]WPX43279.1 YdiU family protein [Undibacterium sp. CCC3.4]
MNSDSLVSPLTWLHTARFAGLPQPFYRQLATHPLPAPYLVGLSPDAAEQLKLHGEDFQQATWLAKLSGNLIPAHGAPLAAVYSGHQFGVWAGQLGDGRALLLGECSDKAGVAQEIQLKGAGPTPYSRSGDGRAVLRSTIREFLCSEAMHALGIPTTRALCITGSDQLILREQAETCAVLTRYAPSFIRFGSFEHWYYQGRLDELKILADFVIEHHYPECREQAKPYQALLIAVTRKTAALMAHWQAVGFMHGVMNTDNMSILGLTLDYGPFGFMDGYDEGHICNHTDQQGRYAYHMQPRIGHWNMQALAQALLPLIGTVEDTEAALALYPEAYKSHYDALLRDKFGWCESKPDDQTLIADWFLLLQQNHADFTLSFRQLSHLDNDSSAADHALLDLFVDRAALQAWLIRYRERLQQESVPADLRQAAMKRCNPKYVLRNYLAQQAIEQAQNKDFSEVNKLAAILAHPFDEQAEHAAYAAAPPDWAGTLAVSCSS